MFSRVDYADGIKRPAPPPARNRKEAMAAWRRAFNKLRGSPPPASFKMRALRARVRAAQRRPAQRPPVVHDCPTHDRPTSTPKLRAAPAQVAAAAAGGRDGNGERDDGGGDDDGGGGGSDPQPSRLITVVRCDRDRDPLAGGAA